MNSAQQSGGKIRASALIDTDVASRSGELFGKVADIIVDEAEGKILFVAVERSGALTSTDNFYRVPWSAIDHNTHADCLTLSYDEDQLAELESASNLSELL